MGDKINKRDKKQQEGSDSGFISLAAAISAETTRIQRAQMETFVNNLPGEDGWWKMSGRDKILEQAKKMLDYGIPLEDTQMMLYTVWQALKEEYGD